MKKILYTVLSVVSIVYIAFLIVETIMAKTDWNPNMGGFTKLFEFIVRFGGVAIIFCFALVNFTGNPLKMAFFILLILAIICYVIVLIVPNFFYNLFSSGSKETAETAISMLRLLI